MFQAVACLLQQVFYFISSITLIPGLSLILHVYLQQFLRYSNDIAVLFFVDIDFTIGFIRFKGISGPLHWYDIACSASKTIISSDYLPLSVDVLYYYAHIYPN